MNDNNPVKAATESASRAAEHAYLQEATVMFAPDHSEGDGVTHSVVVSPNGKDTQFPVELPVQANGDVHVPTAGTPVLIGYRKGDRPIIVAIRYTSDADIPSFKAGERRIAHHASDSNIYLRNDGAVEIITDDGTSVVVKDNTITVNGGSTPVVTDIATTKDADGHVTDVTPITDDTIQL
jgi:hypothetical protein